jgi:hypothetical protein
MASASGPTFLGVAPGLFINITQVVWMRHEKDESITLYLSAPGPDGRNSINLKDKRVLDGLASLLAIARRAPSGPPGTS